MHEQNAITHAGKAEIILQRVEQEANWYEGVGQDAGDTAAVARAQVSATLALAEELRTANLIALLEHIPGHPGREILHDKIIDRLGLS